MMKFNERELTETLTIMSKTERGAHHRSNLFFLTTQVGTTEVLVLVEVSVEFHTGGGDGKIAIDRKILLDAVKQAGKEAVYAANSTGDVISILNGETFYERDNYRMAIKWWSFALADIQSERRLRKN